MKVEELRIGNLILDWNNKPVEVEQIQYMEPDSVLNHYSELVEYAINEIHIDQYKPIPLTEEWLTKFGFGKYKDEEGESLRRKGKILLNKAFRLRFSDTNDDWYYSTAMRIETVHQLQNLYFALTGEELQIQKVTT